MQHIRKSVFETNSSSSHSLVIDTVSDLTEQPFTDEEVASGHVIVLPGEFGWEVEQFYGVHDKLSYLYTSAASGLKAGDDPNTVKGYINLDMIREAVEEHTGLTVLFSKNSDDYYPFGYIDHQSIDVPHEVFRGGKEAVIRFLFFQPVPF